MTVTLQYLVVRGVVLEWSGIEQGSVDSEGDSDAKGTVTSISRPSVCLKLMWKLLTGIFADKIYDHLLDKTNLLEEQKRCRKR